MENLIHMSVRIRPAVGDALERMARDAGQELADYAAMVLTEHAVAAIKDEELLSQLRAEVAIKRAAAEIARRLSPPDRFNPDVTLGVFQEIRGDKGLAELYRAAIGGGTGFERNNPTKARINRTIGSICRVVSGGSSKGPNGEVMTVQVTGEFCQTYTRLSPPDSVTSQP
jgi:hypothetical protein